MTNHDILLNNIDNEMSVLGTGANSPVDIKAILHGFVLEYGAELFPDTAYHMDGPVSIIKGNSIEACTRKLETKFRLNTDRDDLRSIYGKIANEFRGEIARMTADGKIMCPYVPITTTGDVFFDPECLEPVISFMTRFGACDAPK